MIKEFIATGKTIEDAIENAKAGLNAPAKFELDVHIEVLEQPRKKLLGLFGGADAKVKASYDDGVKEKKASKKQNKKNKPAPKKEEAKPETKKAEQKKAEPKKKAEPATQPAKEEEPKKEKEFPKSVDLDYAKSYLAEIVKGLDIDDAKIDAAYEEGVINIELSCEDYGIIIGRRGETLDSIQYLLSLAMKKKTGSYVRVSINVGNYREKRNETLRHLADKNSQYVLRTGRRYTFEPMNPYERRIIHTAVQEIEGVESRSIGYNQDRRVVIEPVGGVKPRQSRGRGGRGTQKSAAVTSKPADYTPKKDRADLPKYGKIEISKDQ
ncbi:MAG: protein jag [Ruminococcaceae bacterium]|nr:protein jag [Oscillospiraceae bacterium]